MPSTIKVLWSKLDPSFRRHYADVAGRCAGKLAEYALEVPQQLKKFKLSISIELRDGTKQTFAWDLSDLCSQPYPYMLSGAVEKCGQCVFDAIRAHLHRGDQKS